MPDLPVYLWWRGVPQLSDKVFHYLGEISDRVIIDSAAFADPHGDTVKLATLIRENPKWTAFTDLNWARLTAWRALFAGFYDVAQYRPILDQTNSLVVEYAPPDQNPQAIPARAMLLAGWIASRLHWSLTENPVKREGSSTIFNFSADGRDITISFVPTANSEIRHGMIAFATIGCSTDNHADFKVSRSADGKRIETAVQIDERSHMQRVLGYESWDEAALIGREIEILGHDRVYEQAITAAGEMITALER
jgi:glucose-6-phosphate dehydrogenase assembly protein OpcA